MDATSKAMDRETRIITVADREADIFALFALPRPNNMDLLIRAVQDRRVQVGDSKVEKAWQLCNPRDVVFCFSSWQADLI